MMELLAGLTRGELPTASAMPCPDDVIAAALRHGILPLVHAGVAARRADTHAGAALESALAALARSEAAADVIRVAALRELLQALAEADIPLVIFKGSALAFTHYSSSHLRPRDDTDILVARERLADVERVMTHRGYRAEAAGISPLVSHQRLYTRSDGRGLRHNVDIHWRISNRQRYADLFTLEELLTRARPLPVPAVCPCPVDAVLIAALHRSCHRGTDRLVWLYDVHRLLGSMEVRERAELEERVVEKGLAAEYQAAVHGARYFFGRGTGSPFEVSTGVRTIDVWRADLQALPGWGARAALLLAHAFPPADYMRRAGRGDNRLSLLLAYLTRALRGSVRLFRRA